MAAKECTVCYETYTAQMRKPVLCPYCDHSACVQCQKNYLVSTLLDAHCMNCRRAWNDEFIDLNFTRVFRTGIYRKHREKILVDRELALLPTRQGRVEATVKKRDVETQQKQVKKELLDLDIARFKLLDRVNRLNREHARYKAESEGLAPPAWTLAYGEVATAKPERAKFIMKCPDDDCRGFLSTAYKCGTCQKWACPDCLVIHGTEKPDDHVCDENLKASVALIIKESKACPKCGVRISKIDGCDMMWCVDCHTAFSWQTGNILEGHIHNPHYYEFMRKQNNGQIPRNPGDVPGGAGAAGACGGGPPYVRALMDRMRRNHHELYNTIINVHRITCELRDYHLANYQREFDANDNGDLGVMYLIKEIDKEKMQKELVKRETKRNKHIAIRAVLEMFFNTSAMMLTNIANTSYKDEELKTRIEEFEALRQYANESLTRISRMKNCSVPQISPTWRWIANAKAAPLKRVKATAKAKATATAAAAAEAAAEEEVSEVESED